MARQAEITFEHIGPDDLKAQARVFSLGRIKLNWSVNVELSNEVANGNHLLVQVSACHTQAEYLSLKKKPENNESIRGWFLLVNEKLNTDTTPLLRTITNSIRDDLGLSVTQSIAYMTQAFLLMLGYLNVDSKKEYIFVNPKFIELFKTRGSEGGTLKFVEPTVDKKAPQGHFVSLQKFLEFWTKFGARVSSGFMLCPDGQIGNWSYFQIPALFIPFSEYRKFGVLEHFSKSCMNGKYLSSDTIAELLSKSPQTIKIPAASSFETNPISFIATPDFRTVWIDQKKYSIDPLCSKVMELIYRSPNGETNSQQIQEIRNIPESYKSPYDLFSRTPEGRLLWKDIIKHPGRGERAVYSFRVMPTVCTPTT